MVLLYITSEVFHLNAAISMIVILSFFHIQVVQIVDKKVKKVRGGMPFPGYRCEVVYNADAPGDSGNPNGPSTLSLMSKSASAGTFYPPAHVLKLLSNNLFMQRWRPGLTFVNVNTVAIQDRAFKFEKIMFYLDDKKCFGLVLQSTPDSEVQGREVFLIFKKSIVYYATLGPDVSARALRDRMRDILLFQDFLYSDEEENAEFMDAIELEYPTSSLYSNTHYVFSSKG
jgi:hypothetical protein